MTDKHRGREGDGTSISSGSNHREDGRRILMMGDSADSSCSYVSRTGTERSDSHDGISENTNDILREQRLAKTETSNTTKNATDERESKKRGWIETDTVGIRHDKTNERQNRRETEGHETRTKVSKQLQKSKRSRVKLKGGRKEGQTNEKRRERNDQTPGITVSSASSL